ncbi:hypothetical protein ACQ4LE_011013 [Meloidogyne hapla]
MTKIKIIALIIFIQIIKNIISSPLTVPISATFLINNNLKKDLIKTPISLKCPSNIENFNKHQYGILGKKKNHLPIQAVKKDDLEVEHDSEEWETAIYPNRTDFEQKLVKIEESQIQGQKNRKRVPKTFLLPLNNNWEDNEAFDKIYLKVEENNKKEKNLIMVAKLIKKRYPNVDEENKKTPFKEMAINQQKEAVDLKLLLDECDRIIEFWPSLCIAEEQLREKRENEEWKYQRKLKLIKNILMALLDIEAGNKINLTEKAENEKQNLHKMDYLIDGLYLSNFMKNEVKEIKDRVIKAEHLIEQATNMLIYVNNNIWVFDDKIEAKEENVSSPKIGDKNEEKNAEKDEDMKKKSQELKNKLKDELREELKKELMEEMKAGFPKSSRKGGDLKEEK